MRSYTTALGAILQLALFSTPARPQQVLSFEFTSIDVPRAGASDTKAFDINARGDIVGRYFVHALGPFGFVLHHDGTFTAPVVVPTANTGTVLRSINARGDIAGKYFDIANVNGTHGFLIGAQGDFTSFDVPATAPFKADPDSTVANGINNLGNIVGVYSSPTDLPLCHPIKPSLPHGFVRDSVGNFTPIDFPGAPATLPRGINDRGDIVGFYIVFTGSTCNLTDLTKDPIVLHGFLRTTDGNYVTVDAPGATNSGANGINDAGDIVGGDSNASLTAADLGGDSVVPSHNFILRGNGSFTSFDVFILGTTTLAGGALGINARGDVVGVYSDGVHEHGFLGTRQP